MKRIFSVLMLCSIVLLSTVHVNALTQEPAHFESALNAAEYAELSSLEPELVDTVNQVLSTQYGNTAPQISRQDINWDDAYKIYIDANIYTSCENSTNQILAFLEEQTYIWEIPISKGGIDLAVDLSVGLPLTEEAKQVLTEEQQQEVQDRTGKWGIDCVEVDRTIPSYKKQFQTLLEQNQITQNSTCVFLGGFSSMRSVTGVCLNDQTVEKIFPIEEPRLMGTVNTRARNSNAVQIQQNEGYSFEQVAQTLDTLTPLPPNTDGLGATTEQPFDLIAIVLLSVCIVALAGVIVFAKKRC